MAVRSPPRGQRGSLQPARSGPTRPPPTRSPLGKASLAPGRPPAPQPPHSSPGRPCRPLPPALTGAIPRPPRRSCRKEVRPATPRFYTRGGDVTAPARGARREAPALSGRWRLWEGNPAWNSLALFPQAGTRPHAFLFLPHAFLFLPHDPQPPVPRPWKWLRSTLAAPRRSHHCKAAPSSPQH